MTGSAKKDTDTVRAMLTPGEAVLTVAAAERVGRKNIAMLNKTAKSSEKPKESSKVSKAKARKYDDGTSKVIKDDYSKDDLQRDAEYQSSVNDIDDKTQNKEQGPTPLNLSNMQYAQKNGEKTIWNGPTGKRDTPSYSKGTAKVPQPRMSKVDRVVDRLFKK